MHNMKTKKSVFCLAIISILIFTSSCSKPQQSNQNNSNTEELYNYEVTSEPFESMPIVNSYANHVTYNNADEMFDDAEIVIIGMPVETFTDGEERFFDSENNEVEKDSGVKIFHRSTIRNIKVLKVIKGEWTEETIKIAEKAVTKTDEKGNKYISGLPEGQYIAKKNVKYIYYLTKSLTKNADFYFTLPDQGLINIDGLDTNSFSKVSSQRLNEVKSRFSADFAKYDRSNELTAK